MARNYKNKGSVAPVTEKKGINGITVTIVALALVAAILLTVFLVNFLFSPRLVMKNGGASIIDKKSGVTYKLAPSCYSADLDTDNVYAKIDGVPYYKVLYSDGNNEAVTLDPEKMIGTVDEYGEKTLYAADDLVLPTLEEFKTDKAVVFYIRLIEYPARGVSPATSEEVRQAMINGEAVMRPLKVDEDTMRLIYLGSSEHPHITYVLKYYEDYSGGRFLYDSSTDKCISLGADAFKEVFK